jgi:LPXTG-site transpeptidase (sortase) family protein
MKVMAAALAAAAVTVLLASGPAGAPRAGPQLRAPGVAATATTAAPDRTRVPEPATGPVVVPASRPVRLEVPTLGLSAAVRASTAAEVAAAGGAVHPTTLWEVVWWSEGGAPGTDADNTVYLYGHTWREPAVFNGLRRLHRGDEVRVVTAHGVLRYLVDDVFTVTKADFPTAPKVSAVVPGRLLLVGCFRQTGGEVATTRNLVVTAQLVR